MVWSVISQKERSFRSVNNMTYKFFRFFFHHNGIFEDFVTMDTYTIKTNKLLRSWQMCFGFLWRENSLSGVGKYWVSIKKAKDVHITLLQLGNWCMRPALRPPGWTFFYFHGIFQRNDQIIFFAGVELTLDE